MTLDLVSEQTNIEEKMRGLGIAKVLKETREGRADGGFADTRVGTKILGGYLLPFANKINSFIKEDLANGSRMKISTSYMVNLPVDILAFIALKAIMNQAGMQINDKACTRTRLAFTIARMIEDEIKISEFETAERALMRTVKVDFDARELPLYKRRRILSDLMRKHNVELTGISNEHKAHLGAALIDIFIEATGAISLATKALKGSKHTTVVVEPSDEFLANITSTEAIAQEMATEFHPCVIPPVPWSDDTLHYGTYHTLNVPPFNMIKNIRKAASEAAGASSLDHVYASLNALQDTPWRVNKRVLEVMRWAYEQNQGWADLPPCSDVVPDDPVHEIKRKLSKDGTREVPDYEDEFTHGYMQYCARIHENNRRSKSKRIAVLKSFQLADRFSRYDKLYFPHDLDSRGRAYPKPSLLNPQGADVSKGILEFAEGKTFGENGLFWFCVHGANTFGFDKSSLEDRVDWIWDHLEDILAVSSDPKGHLWWLEADNPACFLAWCFEFGSWYTLPPEDRPWFMSRIPVAVDATCSGLQHYSAMLRDLEGGFHVNLTDCEERQDIYGKVAEVATELTERALETHEQQLAQAWLDFGITRKITKRTVMVVPYAATFNACMRYVDEEIPEEIPGWHGKRQEFVTFGARRIWEAIPRVIPKAIEAMEWISAVARLVAKSQMDGKRIEWLTPSGLPVHQYKFEMKSKRIETHLCGSKAFIRLNSETNKLDPRKMASSVPPSFVHSLDAAHMMLTMAAAASEGMEAFAAVHDSFGVHACEMDRFAQVIREQFVQMYSRHDVLDEFLKSALPHIQEELLPLVPDVPEKGDLDITKVLESAFFFS